MNDTDEDSSLQDNMANLASELSHSNFNVKKFKKLHAAKPIRVSNQRTLTRINTEHSQQKFEGSNISLHSKTVGQGLNKTFRYVDTYIPPKKQNKFFSKPMIKSADRMNEAKSKKKLVSTEVASSNLEKFEKEWGKGKIKERCIEEWLNAILIQYGHNEYFDKSIANCALKKFGIDENSLVAKGLPTENVSRLYRGLFVFGMGFNSLIGQLTNGNMQTLKTIWRIYSIILEYCSKGSMVTVIGEIQRETSAKIAILTNQIVRKQQIIQRNEELNQEKNSEIFREIKRLREDNVSLNNEKTVLVEEYNSTEQAFSEEVSLRLKFQTKINEIYGLHRELGIKHQKLFQDFSTKVQQLRTCADKYFESTIKTQEFRQTQYKLREQLILLKLSSKKQNQYLDELIKQRMVLLNKVSQLQYINLQLQTEVQGLKNKEKRWLNDKINMEATIKFRQKSSKETHSEYQITLVENNRLYILLSDQRKVMEEYQKQKKNFNSKVISIVSENSYHKRKMQEIQRKYDSLQQNYKQLTQKAERLTLQIEIKCKSEESYQSYFSNSEQNLVEMRKINIANEEELNFLRTYHRNMDKLLKDKNQNLQSITNKYEKAAQQLEKRIIQLADLKSKHFILAQQKRMNEQSFDIKEVKLKLIQSELNLKQQQLSKIKLNFQLQQQRLRTQLEMMAINFKNQKFERTTLNSSYIQSLKILQKKNVTERELNVKISLMEGELEKEKTRYNVMEKNMIDAILRLQKQQEKLEETLMKQKNIIVKKQQYQHPMINEDLSAGLKREIQRNIENTAQIKFLKIQVEKAKKFGQQQVEKLNQKYRWDINVLTKQSENKIEVLTNELAFQKKENTQLKQKVKEYEMLAESYKKKISQRETSERQSVYKHALDQKKKEVQRMFQEMQKLQDQLQKARIIHAQHNMQEGRQDQEGSESVFAKLEIMRKELEHEYNLKYRELQREMKNQIIRKEHAMKEEQQAIIRAMSIEQILKLKDMKAGELIKELSITQKTDKFRQLSAHHSVDMNRQTFYKRQMAKMNEDTKNRKQINRLIKHAYEYYN